MNAFSLELIEQLDACLRSLIEISAVGSCLLVTSAGRSFCSGLDIELLKSIREMSPSEAEACIQKVQCTFHLFRTLPCPTICLIQGHCYGAGVDFASVSDIRYASADALFSVAEVHLGIVPDLGTIPFFLRAVHKSWGTEMVLSGRRFTAIEAERNGFLSKVYQSVDELGSAGHALARELTKIPGKTLQSIVKFSRDSSENNETLLRALAKSNLSIHYVFVPA